MADKNATQCGYCTPGFVMNMYSLLNEKHEHLSKDEIEKSLDGNICRCTGYRSILEAMRSFAHDEDPIDIEDIHHFECLNNKQDHHQSCLLVENKQDKQTWHAPINMDEIISLLGSDRLTSGHYRFVSGNTSTGIYKDNTYDIYISLKHVKQLFEIVKSEQQLTVGSGVNLQKLIELFQEVSSQKAFSNLKELTANLKQIANVHVRNVATWSGNLAMKKAHPDFPSDVFIILETALAKLNITRFDIKKTQQMTPSEYLKSKHLTPCNHLIESMTISAFDSSKTTIIKAYKVANRSQNSHSYVNCGINFSLSKLKLISQPSIVFNGLGDQFDHANLTEKFLEGKDLDDEGVFQKSLKILWQELSEAGLMEKFNPLLTPLDYRLKLALSLYYKFALQLFPNAKSEYKSAADILSDMRSISSGTHFIYPKPELFPLTQPIPKLNAHAQTTGESKYVGDLAALPEQLNAAFILSSLARAFIESIDTSEAFRVNGVKKILFAQDIPGENNILCEQVAGDSTTYSAEVLFAEKFVEYAGQPVGLVVAETHEQAKRAAGLVRVTYCNVKKPILTIKEAIQERSFHKKPASGDLNIGDAEKAIKNSTHKISGEINLDTSQFHFYIEVVYSLFISCT
jgi:xanthine dehydrogenase/oxidase